MRLERLGLTQKKPSQGKMEQPARPELPDRLERPAPPVQPERLVQMDEETGRGLIAISSFGELKGEGNVSFPFFYLVRSTQNVQRFHRPDL